MEDQLILFETAKLAAQKKYFNDNDTYFWYNGVEAIERLAIKDMYQDDERDRELKDQLISRPTQSLLQRWLREVHNIDIDIWRNRLSRKFRLDTIYMLQTEHDQDDTEYVTYEECLEIGLQEALTLIQ